ncbi:MAG: NAD-dependent epimerase [Bacteroidota bacterium]
MNILITGTAGFIGYHVAKRMIAEGWNVTGLDSVNDYYDVTLKYDRLKDCGIDRELVSYNKMVPGSSSSNYKFIQLKLEDRENLQQLFADQKFDVVIHLAAQAGVRYSLTNPFAYIDSNITGFVNILECCRHHQVSHLAYASSSSVYGANEAVPFSTSQVVDHPISLYAASKKSNELMAHVYSHLFQLPTTGIRFFTVYGPWGRPDMALSLFTKAILEDKPVQVFNNGLMERDFTYIDDIVEGVFRVVKHPAGSNPEWSGLLPDPSTSKAPYRIYNIGNNAPVKLMDFVETIEKKLGKQAKKQLMPMQPGDVSKTYADVTDLIEDLGYKPATPLATGISNFIDWYLDYYKVEI